MPAEAQRWAGALAVLLRKRSRPLRHEEDVRSCSSRSQCPLLPAPGLAGTPRPLACFPFIS